MADYSKDEMRDLIENTFKPLRMNAQGVNSSGVVQAIEIQTLLFATIVDQLRQDLAELASGTADMANRRPQQIPASEGTT